MTFLFSNFHAKLSFSEDEKEKRWAADLVKTMSVDPVDSSTGYIELIFRRKRTHYAQLESLFPHVKLTKPRR